MGFEPMNNSFADCPLEPLGYACVERDAGIEPAHHPWQGRKLPLHQSRI